VTSVRAAVVRGLEVARLTDRADTPTSELSGGMRRRLLIARGLVHGPQLVLLDEPTVGLDPQIRQQLWSTIAEIRASGVTVLMSTHYIEEAERLCDEVAIMHAGRVVAAGPPRELIAELVGSEVMEVAGEPKVLADRWRPRPVPGGSAPAALARRSRCPGRRTPRRPGVGRGRTSCHRPWRTCSSY
jgi:lipooligosaccharide transport system ATP-binding protein